VLGLGEGVSARLRLHGHEQAGQRGARTGDRGHRGTPLGQVQRDLPADAAAGSGHDRDLTGEGGRRHRAIMTAALAPATPRLADAERDVVSRVRGVGDVPLRPGVALVAGQDRSADGWMTGS
jgi:hypothetical protein